MEKLLALSLWLASFMGCTIALAQSNTGTAQHLTDEQLRSEAFVSNWLKINGAVADKKDAKWFFEAGMRAKKTKNWSAASKAFGDSMIRYPSPQALTEFAEAELRMLGDIRARTKSFKQHKRNDLAVALDFYKAALAANSVVSTMTKMEEKQVRRNVSCLDTYIQLDKVQRDCSPLQAYGIYR